MAPTQSGFDVVLDQTLDVEYAAHGEQIANVLGFKSFCVIDAGISQQDLNAAEEDTDKLNEKGKFYVPPHQVKLGLLGPSGSGQITELETDADLCRTHGTGIQAIDDIMDRCSVELSAYVDNLGFDFSHRTATILHSHTSGSDADDGTPYKEKEVTKWLTIFSRHKIMVLTIIGPNGGTLELKPYWEFEAETYDVEVKPGTIVMLRPDVLSTRFVSDGQGKVLAASCFLLMGRALKKHGQCCRSTPEAQELDAWVGDRLQQIKDDETQDSMWDPDIPREWQTFMNHTYFKAAGAVIAVRGIAGRFAASWDTDAWYCGFPLGADYASEVPVERWDHSFHYSEEPESWKDMKVYCKHGCFMEGVDLFDPRIFGISPAEAKTIDPNQRMVLETGYDALVRSGYSRQRLMNMSAGMYCGFGTTEWDFTDAEKDTGAFGATGVAAAIVSNRLSFCLGMKGPSMTIDTEGSSSMSALYMAAEGIQKKGRGHATEISLAQGVHLMLSYVWWAQHCAAGWLAKEGRCFSFNATADGYVRSDSCTAACLRPIAEPVDDSRMDIRDEEDPFVGILASCVMNHNGAGASLTAPNGVSEQENIVDAIKDAQIAMENVDAVEAHASAGFLADAIEVGSILRAHRFEDHGSPLAITALKTGCGNAVEAGGLAAFIRVLLSGERGTIMPQAHLNQINPHISDYDGSPMMIMTEASDYKMLSSFTGSMSKGFGGTNVYAIAYGQVSEERFPEPEVPPDDRIVFWPGGGGRAMKAKAYTIRGSFNRWEVAEPMTQEIDVGYTFVVTLGEARLVEFQILLNDNAKQVLHPDWSYARKDAVVQGPNPAEGVEGGLNWCIDGRGERLEGWFRKEDMISGAEVLEVDEDERGNPIVKQEFFQAAGDVGNPGDQYKITLLLAGKWRSVTWEKI
mmetsp:Transcript_36285/g.63943  ORF Transcript_36285/g.63943 Transcript_36285/m.63943 type:complete len:911 (+) Transcript_36285:171-2903(+)